MTSTSYDSVVLRDVPADHLRPGDEGADLRTGRWTRLGTAAVLGDGATETSLSGLADAAGSAARAQGYARGWTEGRRAAQAQAAEELAARAEVHQAEHDRAVAELRRAAQALTRAADSLHEAVRLRLDELGGAALDLALQVAEAVLEREIRSADDPGADALRRALAAIPDGSSVTVRLHPDDLALVDAGALGGVVLRPDPALARGDATAATETNLVNATVAGALERVREVLGS